MIGSTFPVAISWQAANSSAHSVTNMRTTAHPCLQNKNDRHKALLAMAVGISQMQNVDIMARKVRLLLEFVSFNANYFCHFVREGFVCSDLMPTLLCFNCFSF